MNAKIPFKTLRYVTLPVATAGFVLFASPSISEASSFDTLHKGDEGNQVEQLQELLTEKGFFSKDINGSYTAETHEAVKAFQKKHELEQDGIAGIQTVGALHVLSQNDEGELVEELQGQLIEQGFLADGGKDGKFGPVTKDAVKSFQSNRGLAVDGIAGPKTFKELYYTQAQKVVNQETETKAEEVTYEEPAQETTTETEQSEQVQQEAAEPAEEAETEQASEEEVSQTEETEQSNDQATGQTIQVEATAYTANCNGCSGVTATGIDLNANPNQKVIAVDPNVIPLGSRVYVEGYGEAIAGDTGGAINGNKVDLYMQSHDEAVSFGRKTINVTILD